METRLSTISLNDIEYELLQFAKTNILAKGVELDVNSALKDLGVDSYSVIEIVLFIERKFGVVLPESDLIPDNLKSIKALASAAFARL